VNLILCKAQVRLFLLFLVVSAKETVSSSLLVDQSFEEICIFGLLVFLEVKNKLFATMLTVPRINTHSSLLHVVYC
jgi:hypothetical protein